MDDVVVLGEDEWVRRGMASALRDEGGVAVGSGGLDEAGVRRAIGARLVIVDVATPERWDRWSGFELLAGIGSGPAVVVCSTGADAVLFRARAVEVGAVAVHDLRHLRTVEALLRLVADPGAGSLPFPSPAALATVSVEPGSRPGAALAAVRAAGAEEACGDGLPLMRSGLTRRAALRIRSEVTGTAGLRTERAWATGGPERDLSLPTWRELVRFVNRARGAASEFDDDER